MKSKLDWEKTIQNILFSNGVKCDSEQFLIEDINSLLLQQKKEIANNFYNCGWNKLEASYYNGTKEEFIENFIDLLK